MFYAVTDEGTRVMASEYGQQSLTCDCFCPGCRERVFLKKGKSRLPHFAHYREAGCSTFSEGESERHLVGKLLLFEWLKEQGEEVELEPWLPKLQQRPDLLVRRQGSLIALEYQCSPISPRRLQARTQGYRQEGYEVFWLLGIDYTLTERLRDRQVQFLRWSPAAAYGFVCLDSEQGELQAYHHLHYDGNDHLRYVKERRPLTKLRLADFWVLMREGGLSVSKQIPPRACTKSLTERQRSLLLRRRDEEHRRFLERIYLQRHSLGDLPSQLFGKPTKTLLYATPSYIWKYDFLLWLHGREEVVTREDVACYLQEAVQQQVVRPRASMELDSCHYLQPLLDFLMTLTEQGMVRLVSPDCWCLRAIPLRRT